MIPESQPRDQQDELETRVTRVILLGLGVIGFGARIWNADSLALWIDEAISARAAQGILLRGIPSVKRFGEGFYLYDRGAFHSYLVSISFDVFGVSTLSARLPGIVFGVALIPVVYLLGSYTVNDRVGMYAAALTTLHPWMIATSRYTRFYAVFQALFIVALVVYLGWLRTTDDDERRPPTPSGQDPGLESRDWRRFLKPRNVYRSLSKRFREPRYVYLSLLAVTLLAARFTHRFYALILGILGLYTLIHALSTRGVRSVLNRRTALGLIGLPVVVGVGITYELIPIKLLELISPSNYSGVHATWIVDYISREAPILWYASVFGLVILIGRIVRSSSKKYADFLVFCIATTFLGLSFAVPIIVGKTPPRYLSPVLPLIMVVAAIPVDAAIRFLLRHPDVRSVSGRVPSVAIDSQSALTAVVVVVLLLGTLPAAVPHFASDGYQAEFSYGSRAQANDLRGPSEYVLNHSSGNVTAYISPLSTPTFYLGWERGEVSTLRYLTTPERDAGGRWADAPYAIGDLDELKQRIREDAERGEVWIVVEHWIQPDRADWIRARSTRIEGQWKGAELYKFRGDEIEILAPRTPGWEDAVVSVEQNVFGIPGHLALGRRLDSNVTWRSPSEERHGEIVLRTDNRWDSVALSIRVYGANKDRYVKLYYSSDGENWTEAFSHDEGGWKTYRLELQEIQKDDETIYVRIVGGSSPATGGGLVDYIRLEPSDLNETDA